MTPWTEIEGWLTDSEGNALAALAAGQIAYRADVRSEDWEMSHDLHAAGLPYAATWRVPITHHGRGHWKSHV